MLGDVLHVLDVAALGQGPPVNPVGLKTLLRDPCPLDDQMQDWRSVGLTQLTVDAASDVGHPSLPRQGMFLAARRAEKTQRKRVF
jgi:hypothetical protein